MHFIDRRDGDVLAGLGVAGLPGRGRWGPPSGALAGPILLRHPQLTLRSFLPMSPKAAPSDLRRPTDLLNILDLCGPNLTDSRDSRPWKATRLGKSEPKFVPTFLGHCRANPLQFFPHDSLCDWGVRCSNDFRVSINETC